MTDVFEEVEEQLRSDRLRTFFLKGWPYMLAVAAAALVVFLAVWGWRHHQESQASTASEAYSAAAEQLQKGDVAGAERGFTELSKSGAPAYRALALMQIAGRRLEAGKTAEGVQLLDEAAKVAPLPMVADAARLKAIYALFDTASLDEIRKRVEPMTAAGRPYSALAREALAMKQLAAGQTAEARTALSLLSLLPDATDDLRSRAQAAVVLIDSGSAKSAPQIAAAAAKLPPLPPAPPPGTAPMSGSAPVQGAPAPAPSAGAAQ